MANEIKPDDRAILVLFYYKIGSILVLFYYKALPAHKP